MAHEMLQETSLRIGQLILDRAETNSAGMYWRTKTGHDADSWYIGANIYSGTAGVALFLIELSRLTDSEEFQLAAHKALLWAENEVADRQFRLFNLYLGSLGVVLVRLRLYEVSGDSAHLDRALKTYEHWTRQVPNRIEMADLLSGAAGIVLGLLYFYNVTKSGDALARLTCIANDLVTSGRVDGDGLCWNRRFENASALCGLAHGAAGIGLGLLEVGRHFDSPECIRAAELALLYEDQHWDARLRNWRDLRVCWTREKVADIKAAYRRSEQSGFPQRPDSVAWCHGAPGIGLTRLRALEILGGCEHLRSVVRALRRTRRHLRISFDESSLGLCHGQCGRAALFLEAYRCLGRADLLEEANQYAERAVAHVETVLASAYSSWEKPVDIGLFLGLSGTGYLFLQILDEDTMQILAMRPPVPKGEAPSVVIEHPYVTACQTSLPCTFRAAVQTRRSRLQKFFPSIRNESINIQEVLRRFAEHMLEGGACDSRDCISEAYAIDSQLLALDMSRTSDTHTFAALTTAMEDARYQLERGLSTKRRVRWSDQILVRRTKWPWSRILEGRWPDDRELAPEGYGMLLVRTPSGPKLHGLSEIEYWILHGSRHAPTLQELTEYAAGIQRQRGGSFEERDFQESLAHLLRSGVLVLAS